MKYIKKQHFKIKYFLLFKLCLVEIHYLLNVLFIILFLQFENQQIIFISDLF